MPLSSMTAYGYGETESAGLTFTCEIRTLNSRYLEVSARLPRHLLALEVEILNQAKRQLRRGKVDIFLDVSQARGAKDLPTLDLTAVRHYLKLTSELEGLLQETHRVAPLSPKELLDLAGVLVQDQVRGRGPEAAEAHREALFAALDRALEATLAARAQEGRALEAAIGALLDELERDRLAVAARRDEILGSLQKTYLRRLEAAAAQLQKAGQIALSQSLAEERALVEVAVLSDKADIEEELTRLATHIRETRRLMTLPEAPGRKLDFMCQEMHREVNTMSNKLVQTEVSQYTLEMKQTIERIRQQVQNIE